MTEGLVSTIIPVFNRPVQLLEAVQSVLDQSYRPIEIIIVDDGSTDNTLHVANGLANSHPEIIRAVSQANCGPGVARERGRLIARGEFIQYLDSDDVLLPGKFGSQVAALRSNPACDVAYGITYFRNADGLPIKQPYKATGELVHSMFPKFLSGRWWETATPLYRSVVCEMAGPWTDLSLEEDWEYDCRVASLGGRLVWCPQPVSEHREHQGMRLSRGRALDSARLRQQARAHELILGHAFRFGLTPAIPEMQHFARALFLLSRQCGAANLIGNSSHLFALARQASGDRRGNGFDFRAYRLAAWLFGWLRVGKITCWLDRVRPGK